MRLLFIAAALIIHLCSSEVTSAAPVHENHLEARSKGGNKNGKTLGMKQLQHEEGKHSYSTQFLNGDEVWYTGTFQ
ncbi:hypothetical protein MJO28_015808 [Puccinia striiformis f. sp. tritici]|uniref:Uncharacterized protein n=1 Tax=Puccinia striiformis f. sp. tritici TaxID=168172 RepID=A0ACC0DPT2_9BASI|nr:hypothetical protein MJO28_015808 [Puccinia striiformis f. sp. tritici]